MVSYENGKIYKVVGGSMTYIGSTTKQYLSQRWAQHKSDYIKKRAKTTAWTIFDSVGIDNCSIILIEAYPCKTIDELKARERYWIEREECVNQCIPGRSKEEYYSTHKEETNTRSKEWYIHNKDKKKDYDSKIIDCPCGYSYTQGNKSRHLKSKRHSAYLPHA